MKSPFPGMDPFIEGCGLWSDFHDRLIIEITNSLSDSAPTRYLVRVAAREYFELIEEEHREIFIEILEAAPDQRLVTSIELLSPANKRPRSNGRKLYLRKRQSLMLGDVNLIEIDLLRGGERISMLDEWPSTPYTVLVAQAVGESKCRVWPAHSLRRLPVIPVPLIKPDTDLEIDLQPMIEAIYKRSRYSRSIDYRKPLDPPLNSDEAAWLKNQLRLRKNGA